LEAKLDLARRARLWDAGADSPGFTFEVSMKYLLPLVLALAACTEAAPPADKPVGMANPASAYCVAQGGEVLLRDTAAGGDATCKLPDGRKVGEWEYFNEHHRPDPVPPPADAA